ncbi:hypothetical protein FHT93_007033 [Rhizobium sp. BK379]|nr:hypothetical protein [Rhizobium sp. BK379]
MTSVVSRIDRMESVFHGPGGYHIRVHQGPAFGDRGRAISRRPARAMICSPRGTATTPLQSSQIRSKIQFPLRCCQKDSQQLLRPGGPFCLLLLNKHERQCRHATTSAGPASPSIMTNTTPRALRLLQNRDEASGIAALHSTSATLLSNGT